MMDSIVNRKHAGSKGRQPFGLVTVTRRRRNQQQKQQQLKTSTVPRCYYPVSFTMFLLPLLLMILLILATMVQGAIAPTKVSTPIPTSGPTTATTNDPTRKSPAHEPVSITNATSTTTSAGTGGVLRVPTTETEKSNTVVTTLGRSLQKQGHEFDANERTRTRQRRKRRGLAFLSFYSDWK